MYGNVVEGDFWWKIGHAFHPEQIKPTKPEVIKPEYVQTLARRGELPDQTVNLGELYGDEGGYVGGHPLLTSEQQSALKEPYRMEVTDPGGTSHTETVDAFSRKDALKVAQKKFAGAQEWSITQVGGRTRSTEYSVPTQKLASTPEKGSTSIQTMRHELGHAMVGLNEGLTTTGMLRHTHPDLSGQHANASVSWPAGDLYRPGTREIKAEKLPAVIKMMMGGVAADEVFSGIPSAENRNLDISVYGSDGQQAHHFLKAAGFTPAEITEYTAKMLDAAKEHLTNPAVSDVIKENENVREPNLSHQYHYSADRLQQMHAEAQRRIQNATGQLDNRAVSESGNANRGEDVARGKGEVAPANQGIPPEQITAAEKSEEPWHETAGKSMAENGAFTINPRTGEIPNTGHWLEAVPELRQVSDKPSTPAEIQKFAAQPAVKKMLAKYPELQIGGYKNDAGKYELNLSASSADPEAARDRCDETRPRVDVGCRRTETESCWRQESEDKFS